MGQVFLFSWVPSDARGHVASAEEGRVPMLKVGDQAPDFELQAIAGDERIRVRSRDYLGQQNVVVTFHPLDWTPT